MPKIDCFIADIRHNRLRLNPLTGEYIGLSEQAIRRFEETVLDESEREVRLHGKFRYLSGRVWKSWDRNIHVIDRKRWVNNEKGVIIDGQPPKHWPRALIIDPHDEKPHALLWVAKEPEFGIYYAYREAWLKNKTFRQVCEHIRDVEITNHERVTYRVLDPNFGPKTQGNTKTTVRDDFEAESRNIGFPMRFSFGDDHVSLGHKKVAEMLWYDEKIPISIINRPYLYVCNDLSMCIYQIEHYVWPDRDETAPDPSIEKPVKKHDDFPACYSADTEILTEKGWKLFSGLNGDKVATLSKKGNLEFQKPTDYFRFQVNGKMVDINARGVKLLVTPNHQMLTRMRNEESYGKLRFKRADKLVKSEVLPISSNGINNKKEDFIFNGIKIDTDVWAEFMGWYISEGSATGTKGGKIQIPGRGYSIYISQFNKENQDKIYNLLRKMPFHFNFYERSGNFVISNKTLWQYLFPLGCSWEKRIPRELFDFPKQSLRILFDTMVLGDGWEHKGNRSIATTSKQLVDDISELLVRTGKSFTIIDRGIMNGNIRGRKFIGKHPIYNITERNRDNAGLTDHNGNSAISQVDYEGEVFCVTVPNRVLLVRRKGLNAFSGNCLRYLSLFNWMDSPAMIIPGCGNAYN